MNDHSKTKEQLIKELRELKQEHQFLKVSFKNGLDEKNEEKRILASLITMSEDFIQFSDHISNNKILQTILDISGASYAAFNIFDDNGLDFTTVALAGLNKNFIKASSFLGFDVINKHWKRDLNREEKTKQHTITHFEHLYDLAGNALSKNIIHLIEKTFSIKEAFVVKTMKNNLVLGDFTLLYKTGETLKNASLVELYANQVGLFLDRNKITNSLRESEEKHRLLIENSFDIIYTLTADGVFMFVSSAWTALLGHPVTEVSGKSFQQFVHPDDLPGCFAWLQKAIATGQRQEGIEYRVQHTNGSWYWHTSSAVPLRDEAGTIIGFEGIARDITQRKIVEDALQKSEELHRVFTDQSPIAIELYDSEGLLVNVNPACLKMFGITDYKEISQFPLFDDPNLTDEHKNVLITNKSIRYQSYFDFEKVKELNLYKTTKSGQAYLDVLITPTNNIEKKLSGYLLQIQDITERKQAEEALHESQAQLLEMNATKDKFFSIIAHDLRTPFNGFLGLTQLMTENLSDLTPSEIQKYAESMNFSAANLYRLLENLLEWSQIQKGAILFNPECLPLDLIVDESMEMIKESAIIKGIEIATDIPDGSEVYADRNMLQTIIRNLVSNAVKYTHKGGKVKLSANTTTSKGIELSIQDTGIGMSRELIESLFRIDVRSNRKGTEGELSTGLGLLLCNEFVKKHGGKIWVESEVGVGSTFYFTLPYLADSVKTNS